MSVLIVVAHPDDEVLGCGGTAAALAKKGIDVQSVILCGNVTERRKRPDTPDLIDDTATSQQILGIKEPILGDFPNIQFNTVPHLDIVKFIEQAIADTGADTIFTHHPGDLNNDHLHTSACCQAASRLFQRRAGVAPLKALFFMEVLSSTEWAFPTANPFTPNTYFPIGDTLETKIQALDAYRDVMRPFPHPRSREILTGLAAYRGGQAGMHYAEAFQAVFMRLDALEGWR